MYSTVNDTWIIVIDIEGEIDNCVACHYHVASAAHVEDTCGHRKCVVVVAVFSTSDASNDDETDTRRDARFLGIFFWVAKDFKW